MAGKGLTRPFCRKSSYEDWPVPSDAFHAGVTPALTQLSGSEIGPDVWKHMRHIFNAENPRDLALRADNWILLHNHPKIPRENGLFNGYHGAPISRLLFWEEIEFRFRKELSPFQYGDAIRHLGLRVSNQLWDDLCESETPLPALSGILDGLPRLEALWIVPQLVIHMQKLATRGKRESCAAHVLQAALACPRLRFVKIAAHVWKIKRSFTNASHIELDLLDEWEELAECPAVFYSPAPLAWSQYTRHVEY